uniref:Uncharacterized protein n=1 Tax=Arundo donax TaxID=35708 RepID=A0A0A9GY18_ARUDO
MSAAAPSKKMAYGGQSASVSGHVRRRRPGP